MVRIEDIQAERSEMAMNKHIPESMKDLDFVKMEEISGKPVKIMAVSLYVNKEGREGINASLIPEETGTMVRTVITGKSLVGDFKHVIESGLNVQDLDPMVFVMVPFNGQMMWTSRSVEVEDLK